MADAKIRLYLEHALGGGQMVPLSRDHAHYLAAVMRRTHGDEVLVFNGRDGEWLATIHELSKRGGILRLDRKTRALQMPPDLWLLFAPIKKARTDFIVEKAAELGVARIQPISTQFTNSERIRRDRLQAHAIEAAEQCGGTYVPEVADILPLTKILDAWPQERSLIFCDETKVGDIVVDRDSVPGAPAAILIGPEGGFSDAERNRLRAMSSSFPISLGPRILRADTAAVAAITLWQAASGDW